MNIKRQLLRYVLLNILSMIGISCYVLADTFFISKAGGADGITALNLTLPIYSLMFAIGSMIGVGSATRFALVKSSGGRSEGYFSNAVAWSVIFGAIFTFLGLFYTEKILVIMGADEAILAIGTPYLRIAMCFGPFFLANYSFTAFVRNDSAPKTAMMATLLSSLFNIVFDYIFMFPMNMGMTGAALATAVSPMISILICMTHLLSRRSTIKFSLMVPNIKMLISSCSLGLVGLIGELASGITTLSFNFILLDLAGNVGVAAYGVVANVAIVGTAMMNGVAQGLQPLASEAHGIGNSDNEKKICRYSIMTGLIIAAVLIGLVWIAAEQIVAVFNSEGSLELAGYAVPGIRYYFTGFLLAAVNIILAGFLSSVGRGISSFAIALMRGVVAIVAMAFLLSFLFGMEGVWFAFPAAELITLLIIILVRITKNEGILK